MKALLTETWAEGSVAAKANEIGDILDILNMHRCRGTPLLSMLKKRSSIQAFPPHDLTVVIIIVKASITNNAPSDRYHTSSWPSQAHGKITGFTEPVLGLKEL